MRERELTPITEDYKQLASSANRWVNGDAADWSDIDVLSMRPISELLYVLYVSYVYYLCPFVVMCAYVCMYVGFPDNTPPYGLEVWTDHIDMLGGPWALRDVRSVDIGVIGCVHDTGSTGIEGHREFCAHSLSDMDVFSKSTI